jgi:hypothetical protein
VDVGASFVAGGEALVVVEPGEGALDDPAGAAESGAVLGVASGDPVTDAAGAEQAAVLVVVVAAIGVDDVGPLARSSDPAADGRDPIEQRQQLGDVVAVAGRGRVRQGQSAAVDDQVVLDA